MISVTQHKRIFVTQYKMDPHNTTYTKLAQVDTGNTIYTKNKVFLILLYGTRPILYFCYMVLIPEAEALKSSTAVELYKGSKNAKKSFFYFWLQIGFSFVLLSCWNSPTPKNPIS